MKVWQKRYKNTKTYLLSTFQLISVGHALLLIYCLRSKTEWIQKFSNSCYVLRNATKIIYIFFSVLFSPKLSRTTFSRLSSFLLQGARKLQRSCTHTILDIVSCFGSKLSQYSCLNHKQTGNFFVKYKDCVCVK